MGSLEVIPLDHRISLRWDAYRAESSLEAENFVTCFGNFLSRHCSKELGVPGAQLLVERLGPPVLYTGCGNAPKDQAFGFGTNFTNNIGVIELLAGFVKDPQHFMKVRTTISHLSVRPDLSFSEGRHSSGATLRNAVAQDLDRAFSLARDLLPCREGRQYYFIVELFGLGRQMTNFTFWHQDRPVLIARDSKLESRDRERIPLVTQGFIFYAGLPSWFLDGGTATNAIELFEGGNGNDALAIWFKGTPWRRVPTSEELVATQGDGTSRRLFIRIRAHEVSSEFFIPTREEATTKMDKRFMAWEKGEIASGEPTRFGQSRL